MAHVFRTFLLRRDSEHSQDSLSVDSDGSAVFSGCSSMSKVQACPERGSRKNLLKLLNGAKKSSQVPMWQIAKRTPRGKGDETADRDAARKSSRRTGASAKFKEGLGLIRDRVRHLTGQQNAANQMANSSGDSAPSDNPEELVEGYGRFKEVICRSENIQMVYGELVDAFRDDGDFFDNHFKPVLKSFCETFLSEAWRVAEKILNSKAEHVENVMKMAREVEVRSKEAHLSYQRDVTVLRDQIRALPSGANDALKAIYFSPLDHHDQVTKDLILACSEERIKQLISSIDESENFLSVTVDIKVQKEVQKEVEKAVEKERQRMESLFMIEREELIQNENQRLEALFQDERAELQRRAAQHREAGQKAQDATVENLLETAELRQDLQQKQLEIQVLTSRVKFAEEALKESEMLVEAERAARTKTALPPVRVPSKELSTPRLTTPRMTSSTQASSQESSTTQRSPSSLSMDRPKVPNDGPSRPVLPGASSQVLMDHAVHLHEGLDSEKKESIMPASDLLNVLEQLGEQLGTEIRQEAAGNLLEDGVLLEASKGTLVITLLTAYANLERCHSSMLLPMVILFFKSIDDLYSTAQGKGTQQMKVMTMSRHLADARSEAWRLVSSCFTQVEHGFRGLDDVRKNLRTNQKIGSNSRCDGQDATELGISLSTTRASDALPLKDLAHQSPKVKEVGDAAANSNSAASRSDTAPDVLILQDAPDQSPKRVKDFARQPSKVKGVGNAAANSNSAASRSVTAPDVLILQDAPDHSPKQVKDVGNQSLKRRGSFSAPSPTHAKAKGAAKAKAMPALSSVNQCALNVASDQQNSDSTESATKNPVLLPGIKGAEHQSQGQHKHERRISASGKSPGGGQTPNSPQSPGGGQTPRIRRLSTAGLAISSVVPATTVETAGLAITSVLPVTTADQPILRRGTSFRGDF